MTKIKLLLSSFSTLLIYYLGGIDVALESLLVFIVIDYFTGLAKAFYLKKLDSRIGIRGLIKKVCYLALVVVAVTMDTLLNAQGFIRQIVIYYIVANEGLSIIENLGAMDILVPDILKEKLEQLKKGE